VQVDPIKPKLKAPGTQRLKLKHAKPLSSFAFNFNLRRYIVDVPFFDRLESGNLTPVGRCRLTLSNPR
jgi:hypothetical protein